MSERNLIEAVKVTFSLLLIDHPRFLEEVISHVAANGVSLEIEIDVHVLAETRRVIISVCLGVAKCLQYWIRLNENVLHSEKRCAIVFITLSFNRVIRWKYLQHHFDGMLYFTLSVVILSNIIYIVSKNIMNLILSLIRIHARKIR